MARRISELLYPRLTVLITTCDKRGRPNVAAFSFLMPISFDPKYLAFAVAPTRHTFDNLKEVGDFVVNVPTAEMLDKVWICGKLSGRDSDKFRMTGLTPVPSRVVRPPRVEECPVQLECIVEEMKEYGDHYLVVGKVVAEHVSKLDFQPLLHLSGSTFFKVGGSLKAKE
ncbi:MAG: flavin reductase family protein [Candidatus Methanodesulfokora sp.]